MKDMLFKIRALKKAQKKLPETFQTMAVRKEIWKSDVRSTFLGCMRIYAVIKMLFMVDVV